jgi:DNA polymerase elongation subunit (family B)
LDFDIENRPLSYLGSDWTTADITAIAASFVDEDEVFCFVQTKARSSQRSMLKRFLELYNEADGVTGHNLKRHDLPHVNGALMELGLPTLGAKLVCDTYTDLKKKSGISGSQENLAAMLGLVTPKIGMNTTKWRLANRLVPEGIQATKERVIGDVVQHKALRAALLERDLLRPPKAWRP